MALNFSTGRLPETKPDAMMETFTNYSIIPISCFAMASCKEDELISPARFILTGNQTAVRSGVPDVVFTTRQMQAGNISLLPYGMRGEEIVETRVVTYMKPETCHVITSLLSDMVDYARPVPFELTVNDTKPGCCLQGNLHGNGNCIS